MAGSKSDFHETAVLNLLRGTAIGAVTPRIALFTTAPTDASPGTEVATGSYARQPVTFGAPTGTSPTSMSNSAICLFATPSAGWGTIVGWGVMDALTAGNMLYYSDQTPNKVINTGDVVQFDIDALVVTED